MFNRDLTNDPGGWGCPGAVVGYIAAVGWWEPSVGRWLVANNLNVIA